MLCAAVQNHRRQGCTRGTTLMEVLMALGLLLAAAGVFAQVHALAARQQRSADVTAAASQTLANWMERCAAAPAADVNEQHLLELADLARFREHAPDAEATVDVAGEANEQAGQRMTLLLRWPSATEGAWESQQLVAWRYDVSGGLKDEAEARP